MTIEEYKEELLKISNEDDRTSFVQKYYFNGTPFLFKERDNDYYDFTKRVADNFNIKYSDFNDRAP